MKLTNIRQITSNYSQNDLVNDWLGQKKPETVRAYRQDLESLTEWAPDAVETIVTADSGTANRVVARYKSHMVSMKLAPATINRRLAAIRSLVSLAKLFGLCQHDISIGNVRSQAYRDTRGPGRDAVVRMVEATSHPRDRALLVLLYNNALRRGEAVAMNIGDVDFDRQTIAITGKGRRESEQLTVSSQTLHALLGWIRRHPNPVLGAPLFVSLDNRSRGKRLTGRSAARIVRSAAKKAGTSATPHGLRHTAITEALEATDGDVRAVRKYSRHAKLDTLLIYDDSRQDMHGEIAKTISIG